MAKFSDADPTRLDSIIVRVNRLSHDTIIVSNNAGASWLILHRTFPNNPGNNYWMLRHKGETLARDSAPYALIETAEDLAAS